MWTSANSLNESSAASVAFVWGCAKSCLFFHGEGPTGGLAERAAPEKRLEEP